MCRNVKVKNLIILIYFAFSLSSVFTAPKDMNIFQEYVYSDNKVNVSVKVFGKEFCHEDSLDICILVTNNSEDELLLFDKLGLLFNVESGVVVLDYGGGFESSVETVVDLRRLPPSKSRENMLKIPFKTLVQKGFGDFLKIALSFGYISSIQHLDSFRDLSTISAKDTSPRIIMISSIIVDAALTRHIVGGIDVKIINCGS